MTTVKCESCGRMVQLEYILKNGLVPKWETRCSCGEVHEYEVGR